MNATAATDYNPNLPSMDYDPTDDSNDVELIYTILDYELIHESNIVVIAQDQFEIDYTAYISFTDLSGLEIQEIRQSAEYDWNDFLKVAARIVRQFPELNYTEN